MKNYFGYSLLVLTALALSYNTAEASAYTLKDGTAFDGTPQEYVCANTLVEFEEKTPAILEKAWSSVSKKYKFPDLKQIISGAKTIGSAKYNPDTNTFTLNNTAGDSGVVFAIKHKLSKSKVSKLITDFSQSISKQEKDFFKSKNASYCDSLLAKAKEGTDIKSISDYYMDYFYEIGYELGTSLLTASYEIEGATNKSAPVPVLNYIQYAKNPTLSDSKRGDYYYDLSKNFNEELIVERFSPSAPTKVFYLNIILDKTAPANTTVDFKLDGFRALSTLKFEEVLPSYTGE